MDESWKNIIDCPIPPIHIVQHFDGLEGTLKEGESLGEITVLINEVSGLDRDDWEFLNLKPENVVMVLRNRGPSHYDEIFVSRYQAFRKEDVEAHYFDLILQTGRRPKTNPSEDLKWSTPFPHPLKNFEYFRPTPFNTQTDDSGCQESFQDRLAQLMKDFKRIMIRYEKQAKV